MSKINVLQMRVFGGGTAMTMGSQAKTRGAERSGKKGVVKVCFHGVSVSDCAAIVGALHGTTKLLSAT